MQKKTAALYFILTCSALIMNYYKLSWRYEIFLAMLLFFPYIADRKFTLSKTLLPTKDGLREFAFVTFLVLLFFPAIFFFYFIYWKTSSFTTPDLHTVFDKVSGKFALIAILAFGEEVFFRAFLQEHIFSSWNKKLFSIISQKNFITSLIFGLTHAITLRNPAVAITFFPSLLFGWFTEKSKGSIAYSTIFHALSNIFQLVLFTFIN